MDNTAFRVRNAHPSFSLQSTYVHLKDLGSATAVDVDREQFWREAATRSELQSGRIVVASRYEKDMAHWEMHPSGDELLVALSGEFEVLLQGDGRNDRSVALAPGQAFLVPFGIWHRVLVKTPGEVLFVTPGKGTQHRVL